MPTETAIDFTKVRAALAEVQPEDFFSKDGIYSQARPGFRARKGQADLARIIYDRICTGEANANGGEASMEGHVFAEGPTGFGKSLVCLAAIFSAILNGKARRVVLSTETLALATQYQSIDLPFVQAAVRAATGRTVTFAEAKGKSNFVCLAKLPIDETEGLSRFDHRSMTPLQQWAASQVVGKDAGDLGSVPAGLSSSSRDWYEISADDDCERRGCPFYGRGANPDGETECFVFQARKEFMQAQIVVTNHTLLLLDRAPVTRESPVGPILADKKSCDEMGVPGYDVLVVDEGHGLPEKARDAWGHELSPRTVSATVRGIARMFRRAGLDPFGDDYLDAWRALEDGMFEPFHRHMAHGRQVEGQPLRLDRDKAGAFDRIPGAVLAEAGAAADLVRAELKATHRALRKATTESDLPEAKVSDLMRAASERFSRVIHVLQAVFDQNGSTNEEMDEDDAVADNWLSFVEIGKSAKAGDHAKLKTKPIDVGPLMRAKLFATIPSVTIASATLRSQGSFYFPTTRMGLRKGEAETFVGQTPFDFGSQVEGYFPTNLPFPPSRASRTYQAESDEYNAAMSSRIVDLFERTGGGGLVLCTSVQDMESLFWLARDDLKRRRVRGIDLMMQGDAPKHILTERMRTERDACLFATKSFFTGVDIPGESLRLVVMLKAPFPVPGDPMFQAQCERIKMRGGSDFRELSLPLMLMELLQGFGRLIRSETDSGLFALLDSRANTKSYGQDIRKALPKMRTIKMDADKPVPRPGEEEEDEE